MKTASRLIITAAWLVISLTAGGQQYLGTPGLIHVPTADMDTTGVVRAGAHYLPAMIVPDGMKCDGEKFNTLTNYLSITPFHWIEVGYGYTLWRLHWNLNPNKKTGFYAKDRYFSLRLQPLHEARWWPSLVVGGNDVWGSGDKGESGSNFYRNFYVAATKHFNINDWTVGTNITYRRWDRDYNHKWNGVVGGVTLQPTFYNKLRFVGEWDGDEVNIGADCTILKYFLLQASIIDFRYVSGGVSLYLPLKKF